MRTVKALDVAAALPAPATDLPRRLSLGQLRGLLGHAVWLMALFAVCAAAVGLRLEVQQLRKDLDRNTRLYAEATLLNERLRLEHDARRRAVAVEALAERLEMTPNAPLRRVVER